MPLRIDIDKALLRARETQPANTDIISLRMLPDGQWIANYIQDKPAVKDYDRLMYEVLECPLFNNSEI